MKPSFTIMGARGTLPVAGKHFEKYGGHTTCFCLKTSQGMIVIDAGTGISLIEERPDEESLPAALLFTHFHLDHITALPFLKRLGNRQSSLKLMTDSSGNKDWQPALMNLFTFPYWPVKLTGMGARVEFNDLPAGSNHLELYGAHISWCPLSHPQGCFAYRLETAGKSVVIVTDHENGNDKKLDDALLRLCSKADFLVHDAQYTPEEMEKRRGWGHSSWREGAEFAGRAGVGELILTHHDFKRRDDEIDKIVETARAHFPKTRAACEKMILF
jgi:phosphoribosyl 1,2-cyclic phosphodiesterase